MLFFEFIVMIPRQNPVCRKLKIETLMFQTGYLTIKEIITKSIGRVRYKLEYPNSEVKLSFNEYILDIFVDYIEKNKVSDLLYDILEEGDISKLEDIIYKLFASLRRVCESKCSV